MAKSITSLSGTPKDDYLGRILAEEAGLNTDARQHLAERLQREVTRVWVRAVALADGTLGEADPAGDPAPPEPAAETPAFNPYSPNVVVVIRRSGRESALAALATIEQAEQLKKLAREQQLGVDTALTSPAEICAAIVAAAERRIANLRAAAG